MDRLEDPPGATVRSTGRDERSSAEQLLAENPFDVGRRFLPRERMAEAAVAAAFLAAALAMALLLPWNRPLLAAPTAALLLTYVIASRVSFDVGAGVAVPTELVLVPMLFVLPAAVVPLVVAAALILGTVPDLVTRRGRPERIVSAIADAWHALGPALVLVLAQAAQPSSERWPVYAAALAAQFAADFASSSAREWLGRGISPTVQLRVLAWVYLIDSLLAPIGLLAAFAAVDAPYLTLLVLPLVALLAVFARDRGKRIRHALELSAENERAAIALARRVEELNEQRAQLELAIRRVGKAFSSSLDRSGLFEIVVQTAADALTAQAGRILAGSRIAQTIAEQARTGDVDRFADLLGDVESKVLAGSRLGDAQLGESCAIACVVAPSSGRQATEWGVVALARSGPGFSAAERRLLSYLATQAASALENIALHEIVRRQAVTDGLTGLANHRRLQDFLAIEAERSTRLGRPLALILLDLDKFKSVNDTFGHQTGDLVLKTVARTVAANCRDGDEPARYGGEEIAIALPGTDIGGAYDAAERFRRRIEALEIPLEHGHRLKVTASFGVAALPAAGEGGAALIAAADGALYQAKRTGRNRTARADRLEDHVMSPRTGGMSELAIDLTA